MVFILSAADRALIVTTPEVSAVRDADRIIGLLEADKKEKSEDIAKDRLKLVLIHDRLELSPHLLEEMAMDIIRVISKYAEIDDKEIDVKMTQEKTNKGSVSTLVASVPVIKLKTARD